MNDEGGTQQRHARSPDRGSACPRSLLREDELLEFRQPCAAVLLGPARGHPAVLTQRPVPVACGVADTGVLRLAVKLPGALLSLAGIGQAAVPLRQPRLDEFPDFGSEGCLF